MPQVKLEPVFPDRERKVRMRTKVLAVLLGAVVASSLVAEVQDSTWNALLKRDVVIDLVDGSQAAGELIGVEAEVVTLMSKTGEVRTIKKVDVREVRGAVAAAPAAPSDVPLGSRYFSFNPIGLLQFGPSLDFGLMITDGLYIVPDLRLAGLSVLHYFVSAAYPSLESIPSFAPGVRVYYLFKQEGKPNCWYLSGLAAYEFWWNTYVNTYSSATTYYHTESLIIGGGFGYRWRGSNHRFFELGLFGGAAVTTLNESWTAGQAAESLGNVAMLVGMVELSFGWEWGGKAQEEKR